AAPASGAAGAWRGAFPTVAHPVRNNRTRPVSAGSGRIVHGPRHAHRPFLPAGYRLQPWRGYDAGQADPSGNLVMAGEARSLPLSARRRRGVEGPAILSYGFRPFFLLGAPCAGLTVLAWLPILSGSIETSS